MSKNPIEIYEEIHVLLKPHLAGDYYLVSPELRRQVLDLYRQSPIHSVNKYNQLLGRRAVYDPIDGLLVSTQPI